MEKTLKLLREMRSQILSHNGMTDRLDECIKECEEAEETLDDIAQRGLEAEWL